MVSRRGVAGLSLNILLLGLVSLITDGSSEMMMPILPFFITSIGGGVLAVGLIGGLADSTASLLQVFSGYWSDMRGCRKPIVALGYGLSAIFKVLIALSVVWQHILIFRSLERVGKGLRTAPRDALIADSTPSGVRGRAFGLHRAMDTAGAVLGSLLAFILFWLIGLDFRPILLTAAILAFVGLIPLAPVKEVQGMPQRFPLRIGLKGLPRELKLAVVVITVFTLGDFTYMLFILRAQAYFSEAVGGRMADAIPILLYVLFNTVYAFISLPAGILSDRIGRKRVLSAGYATFGLTCLGFIFADSLAAFSILFASYGFAYAMVEGNQRALTSDMAPRDVRGMALGTLHTSRGVAALPASLIASSLWGLDPRLTFTYGSAMGLLSATMLLLLLKER